MLNELPHELEIYGKKYVLAGYTLHSLDIILQLFFGMEKSTGMMDWAVVMHYVSRNSEEQGMVFLVMKVHTYFIS